MTETIRIPITRVKSNAVSLPRYMTEGSSGMDLSACLEEDITLGPGQRSLIPTGIAVAIPEGFEGQVRPRSGLAIRNGIGILNAPGTIDADYRGEIAVVLVNLGQAPFTVRQGDRIAQLTISRVMKAAWEETEDLPPSVRQGGGFGHTGV
jgi:dUTP pyrophosphatase